MITKFIYIIVLIVSANTLGYGQGLFRYFNWSAYSDGPEKIDHIVFDFNTDRFQNLPNNVTQGYFNFGANITVFHDKPINKKGTIAIGIGIGFSGFNVHHNGYIKYTTDAIGVTTTELLPYSESINFKQNKINLKYVEIPFEIRIRSMKESVEDKKITNFRFYLGFKGGYLVNNHIKYKDEIIKTKTYNTRGLLEYRYGPTLKIGFKKIGFQAFYSLTSIFKSGLGPEVYPFSVGLTWMRL